MIIDKEILELEDSLKVKQPIMDDRLYYRSPEYSKSSFNDLVKSVVFGSISGIALGFIFSDGKFIGNSIYDGGILAYAIFSIFIFSYVLKKLNIKSRQREISRLIDIRNKESSTLNEKKDIIKLLEKELKERRKLKKEINNTGDN